MILRETMIDALSLLHGLLKGRPIECRHWRMSLRHEKEGFVKLSYVATSRAKVGNAEPSILDKGSNYFPGVEDEIRKHQFSYSAVPPQGET